MQRMKPLFYVCCLILFSLTSQAINAQKAVTGPLTVGFDVGFVLSSQGDSVSTSPVNTQLVQIKSNYRFTRWLGMSASIGYSNVNVADDDFIKDFLSFRNGEPWGWVRKTHRIPVTIGPELNMRVGQGDLSVAAQFGFIFHQSKVHLNNSTNSYVLQYSPTIDTYNSLSFNYTYWPQKRFGVSIGVQFQDWLSSTYSSPDLSSGSQQAELEASIINWTRPQEVAYEFNLFQVGLTYRL